MSKLSDVTVMLTLCCLLSSCGGKSTPVTAPTSTPLSTATFSAGGSSSITFTLSYAEANIVNFPSTAFGVQPTCTLHAGSTPMVFTAGSSSTWFTVTPQAGNLQPNGTTAIGISRIIWSNVAVGGSNNGFAIVSASGYNQLTGLHFSITGAGTDTRGDLLVTISFSCP